MDNGVFIYKFFDDLVIFDVVVDMVFIRVVMNNGSLDYICFYRFWFYG